MQISEKNTDVFIDLAKEITNYLEISRFAYRHTYLPHNLRSQFMTVLTHNLREYIHDKIQVPLENNGIESIYANNIYNLLKEEREAFKNERVTKAKKLRARIAQNLYGLELIIERQL